MQYNTKLIIQLNNFNEKCLLNHSNKFNKVLNKNM